MMLSMKLTFTNQWGGEAMSNDVWLSRKIETWYRAAYKAAWEAGGNPDAILGNMPTDLIITMARNDIHLMYKEPGDEEDWR